MDARAGTDPIVNVEGGVIENGKVWRDTGGNEIWCNGGQILREGDAFYWVGYDIGPGRPWDIKLYSSPDLTDWKFRGTIIGAKAWGGIGWKGRPGLAHSRKAGKYVVIFEADSKEWFRHKVGYASCDTIDGDYKFEHAEYPESGRSTGDQSIYQEGDDAYLVTVLDEPGLKQPINISLAIYRLTPDFLHVERKLFEGFDRRTSGNTGREAPHIAKVGDTYYWFASGLVGWNSSDTRYATAGSPAGPWSEMRVLRTDPPSEDSYNTQHDFVIPVAGKDSTTYVYAGDRYSQFTGKGTGRNIFLPLTFEKGEPVLRWRDSWRIDPGAGY